MRFFGTRPLASNLLLALVYALVGQATLALGEFGGVELRRVIWASSGIAVTAGLLLPFPVWIGAALGGALTTFLAGSAPLHVLGTSVANGLEVAMAVALLQRARFAASLERVRDILLLIGLASGAAAATGAFLSVVSLNAVGGVAPGAFLRIFVLWWLTHAMGILVITPVGLTLSRSRETLLRRDPVEVIGVLSAVALVSWLPFGVNEDQIVSRLFFLPFPLLLWAALRLGMAGAALGGLITTWIAMVAAVAHWGPMSIGTPNDTLVLTWIFSNVVILSTLISAALVEEMRRARAEHEVGELRLRAVLDAATEGIVVADAAGTVTHVNPATKRIWPSALTPPSLREPIERTLEPLAAMLPAPAERALLSATPERTGVRGALTFPDGHVWEVEVDQLSGTEVTGARIWSFHDVTARVRAETERLRLEAQLLHTQKLESLGVLAGGIAHDFNNLLMGIRARAELIGMAEPRDPEIAEDVTAILKTSDQAAALCRQMLVYAGRGAIAVRTIDLSSCAREIQEMLRVSVSRQVDLVLALSPEPLAVAGDITQLRQVVMNLVTNGSDAVEATGRSGTVRVRTRRAFLDRGCLSRAILGSDLAEGEYAVLEVSDDGIGMDEATARQIFDPFFSSKGAGRGLGLASTLGVIRGHKGALTLETSPGGGTRFQVALPFARSAATDDGVTPSRVDRAAFRGRTVLVVDDEAEVRTVVTRMLEGLGLAVRQACDGDEALEQLEVRAGAPIDLVLLDLTMPKRSGPATLTEMRARGIRVPVIIASGFSAEAVPEGSGIGGFLQKPFRAETLERAVASVLADR
ncbi:MAG: response regulator [Gemmatimonadetes bacterium]|nr:response regulator [Gemmatimonadota bacterium]